MDSKGVKTRIVYAQIRNVQEDGKWKRIEKARSLKDKGIFSVEYLEKDENYDFEILDYNWNSITFKPIIRKNKLKQDIPIKVNNKVEKVINYKKEKDKDKNVITLKFDESITKNTITIGNHSTTIILSDSRGTAECNEVEEHDSNDNYRTSRPDIYECDYSAVCDNDAEEEAWIMFDTGIPLNNVIIERAELSFLLIGGSYEEADGDVSIRKSNGPYDPYTITWNNAPGSGEIYLSSKLYMDEVDDFVITNIENIKKGFYGTRAYYNLMGEPDGDDEFEAELQCDDESTYLLIQYTECNPSDPCCDESSHFKPSGTVCNAAHDFQCVSADSNGCSGIAYEDRCTGDSGSCSDNNYQIPYDSACAGQVCVQQSCNGNVFQPEGTCSGSVCQVGSSYECPNNFLCDITTCKDSCNLDDDCVSGYICNIDYQICIEDKGNMSTLIYDENGNLIDGLGKTYHYNDFNNLIEIKDKDTGSVLENYTYDHNGNRIKKVEFTGEGIVTTYYDGDFVRTVGPSGTKDDVYYKYNRQIVGKKDSDGNTYFFHPDHLGSTTLITDINGNVVEDLDYEPFGQLIDSSNERYNYEGKELDSSDLYYFGARYQDPETLIGFTQPDTIIQNIYDPQSLNRYSFERNNPYGYTDPSGNYFSPLDALDYASWGHSAHSMYTNPSWENAGWLALDTVFVALPVIGGVGAVGKSMKFGCKYFDDIISMFKSKKGTYYGGKTVTNTNEIAKLLKSINKGANPKAGVTVLGSGKKYVEIAKKSNANYLLVDPSKYGELYKSGKWWDLNKQFLDDTIKRGDEIILATDLKKAGRNYKKEIDYLIELGFEIKGNKAIYPR